MSSVSDIECIAALDATLPAVKEEERPSKWAVRLGSAQQTIRKSIQAQKDALEQVIRRYNTEEEGIVKEQALSRQAGLS